MTVTDLTVTVYLVRLLGRLHVLIEKEGVPLQYDVFGLAWRPRCRIRFSVFGNGFLTILWHTVYRVVADQRGCPTYAPDLSQSLAKMLTLDILGIVHATGTGDCTWYELGPAMVLAMGRQAPVHPIATAEARRRAARPSYSVLVSRVQTQSRIKLPYWRDSPVQFVKIAAASAAA